MGLQSSAASSLSGCLHIHIFCKVLSVVPGSGTSSLLANQLVRLADLYLAIVFQLRSSQSGNATGINIPIFSHSHKSVCLSRLGSQHYFPFLLLFCLGKGEKNFYIPFTYPYVTSYKNKQTKKNRLLYHWLTLTAFQQLLSFCAEPLLHSYSIFSALNFW